MFVINKKNKYLYLFINFNILNIFKILFPLFTYSNECEISTPFSFNNSCIETCSADDIENHICTINNTIIKDQWLNNIIPLKNINDDILYDYVDISMTTNENLVLLASSNSDDYKGNRLFYIIKSNGRGFFIDESPFYLFETEFNKKTNGFIFPIKLNNTNVNKEYILSISSNNILEIYDINGDSQNFYSRSLNEIYNRDYLYIENSLSTFVEIDKNYYLGFIGKYGSGYNFYMNKLSFSSVEINNYSPLISYEIFPNSEESYLVSCYKTISNYIICFYQDYSSHYIAIALDELLDKKGEVKILEHGSTKYFFKCTHFFEETGVFSYFRLGKIFLKFKSFNEETEFTDFYTERSEGINVNLIEFDASDDFKFENNDLIKLSDKKICFTHLKKHLQYLYLVIIYDYYNGEIKIRYYKIDLKIYSLEFVNKLSTSIYKNFICLASTQNITYDNTNYKNSSSLIIFSYPNCKDFEFDITNILKQYQNITFDLNSQCEIDNNIFGLISKEIKILDYTEEMFKLYSSNDSRKIDIGGILNSDENIILILSKNVSINIPEVGSIVYEKIITEPDYDTFYEYTNNFECNCTDGDNEENGFFVKNNYTGRLAYFNIIINENEIQKECDSKCELCLFQDSTKCVFCKNEDFIENGQITCEIHEKLPTTIITTIPETTYIDTILETSYKSTLSSEYGIEGKISDETTEMNNRELKCSKDEILNGKCDKGIITSEVINEIKNDLLKSNNNSILIKTEKINIQISTQEEQKKDIPEVSNIDLGKCEDILKEHYNISKNEQLIIFKIDVKTENLSSTYVQYEVYDPTKKYELKLELCKDVPIAINIPVILDESIDLIYDTFSESGYNIFNENDSFYQDICSTYTTINGTDMLLSDRKKDIFPVAQNQTLCQLGCEFETYNSNTKKAKCNCETKETKEEEINISNMKELFNKKEIADSFYNTLTNSNFRVLKCFKSVFSPKIKNNIGQIFMIGILTIFTSLGIASLIIQKKIIHSFIDNIINKNFSSKKYKSSHLNKKSGTLKSKSNKNNNNNKRKNKKSKTFSKGNKNPPSKKKKNLEKISIKKLSSISNSSMPIKDKNNNKSIIINNINNINILNNKKGISIYRKESRELTKKQFLDNKNKNEFNSKYDKKKYKNLNDEELNTLDYEYAILYDKRTYFQYYFSLLKKKQLILFTFFPNNDYNVMTIKIALFLLSFSLYFTINAAFFSDDTMHKIYEDKGKFNILLQIPQILYSSIISVAINMILKKLSLSESNILKIKSEETYSKAVDKSKKIEICIIIKFILFFILGLIFMLFFTYFISCFCVVYVNTQIVLIKNTLLSFTLSMIYPFGINLFPGFFRIPALRAKNQDKKCLYIISKIIAII